MLGPLDGLPTMRARLALDCHQATVTWSSFGQTDIISFTSSPPLRVSFHVGQGTAPTRATPIRINMSCSSCNINCTGSWAKPIHRTRQWDLRSRLMLMGARGGYDCIRGRSRARPHRR